MSKAQANEWYLEGIKQRSSKVIEAIFHDFFPMIKNHVIKNSGSAEAAQDVFMDAIEAIYRKVREDKLQLTSKFSTYLFEVCRRLWLNELRKQKRIDKQATIDDPKLYKIVEELNEPLEKTERYRLMREKFQLLKADCQRILSLSWHSQHSLQEIATMMDLTYGYARKRKHLCKTKLIELVRQDRRFQELS